MIQAVTRFLRRSDRGGVAILYGLLAMPMAMIVGLAVDYSSYITKLSQLNLAADAAAMHAVRVASVAYSNGQTTVAAIQTAGQQAGQQWFAAQLGQLANAQATPVVTVNYVASPSTFNATVTYSGTVSSYFGSLFNITNFPISGTASAVVSNAYVEIDMMVDNSSSMLIGASLSDIVALEQATPCSTQGGNEGQNMANNYSWNYTGNYGFGSNNMPPPPILNGSCDSRYTGDPSACTYGAGFKYITPGNPYFCSNRGGSPGVVNGVTYPYMPNAPCAFACHNSSTNNDYYGLARSLTPAIQLRLDVVQQAAANVISTLQNKQQFPNQFLVGLYQFNTQISRLYPTSGTSEAGTDLTSAQSIAVNLKNTPNLSPNSGNTDFPTSATQLNALVTSAGNGTTPSGPLKNLFIVTDGMENINGNMGAMTSTSSEQYCSLFWNKGFNVYVLYTPYLPLPNPYYLTYTKQYAEPTSSSTNVAALQACARYPGNFFQASDPTAINQAMQDMLAKALNSPGRVSN